MTKNYNDLGVEFKYLIVNDMDQKFGLWVNTVGFQSIQPNSPYPLKDHPSGYFFNAQKGRVYVSISWFTLLKVEDYLHLRLLLRSKFVRDDSWYCFPDSGIHTTHTSRQGGMNTTLVLKDQS